MQLQKFGLVLSLLAVTILASGCSTGRKPLPAKIVTQTEYQSKQIQEAARPKPIELYDVDIRVVSEKNIDEFLEEFRNENGQLAIVAFSIRGYQNLALNVSELERYIRQQKEVILYYEKAIKPSDDGTESKPTEQTTK